MNYFFLLAVSLFSFISTEDKKTNHPPSELLNSLNDKTFDAALEEHSFIFVEFYISWCSYCSPFYEQFDLSSKANPSVPYYKVDLEPNPNLSIRFSIESYPTYLLVIKNHTKLNPTESNRFFKFRGPYIEKDFNRWIAKKTVSPLEYVSSLKVLSDEYENKKIPSLIYFSKTNYTLEDIDINKDDKEDSSINAFAKFAYLDDRYHFGFMLLTDEVSSQLNISNSNDTIVIFKQFDNKISKISFSSINITQIDKFVIDNAHPYVMEFNDESRELIFNKQKPGLILIRDPANLTNTQYENEVKKVAGAIQPKLQTVICGLMNRDEPRLIDFLGIGLEDTPVLYIFDTRDSFRKFKLSKRINEENIIEFISQWEKNQLEEDIQSEKEPVENKGAVMKLVGTTFKKMVDDDEYDRVVKFYSPVCEYCQKFKPIYEKIAKKYVNANVNKHLKIYEIDITKNDIGNISVRKIPSVKMWKAKNKKLNPLELEYEGELTENKFEAFLLAKTKYELTEVKVDASVGDL